MKGELDILKKQVSSLMANRGQFALDNEEEAENEPVEAFIENKTVEQPSTKIHEHDKLSAPDRVAEQPDNQVNMSEENSIDVHSRLDGLEQEVLALSKHVSALMTKSSHLIVESGNEDNQSLIAIEHTLHLLQGYINKLEQRVVELQTVHEKYLQELWSCVEALQETKAEKEDFTTTLQDKADIITLERKVSRATFEKSCDELNSELCKMMNRLASLELDWQKSITELAGDLDKQTKKIDLDSLKTYVEKEIKAIQRNLSKLEVSRNLSDDAAGTKKRLLKCISCSKPRALCENSGWTFAGGLPFNQSSCPYPVFGTNKHQNPLNTMETTIIEKELTQLQKQHSSSANFSQPTEISGFSFSEFQNSSQDVDHMFSHPVLNEHSPSAVSVAQESERVVSCNDCFHRGRNCGGKHTVINPFSRTKKSVLPSFLTPPPYTQETVLKGNDGHVYRGTLQKSFLERSPNWDHLLNIQSGRPTSSSS
ncbi:glutamine-rich protein 2-like isoform X2 [Limulus polyphemus]|uniref:Glutamine-rich protein 2-like isoform X2 n=1 Tax=Limulus polyphemus TaxID=6850 RepID=A0ABM1T8Z8_LIMPO|nr:glutamine-rich protein 2-like isoform X2 [Limulus polyphemus]